MKRIIKKATLFVLVTCIATFSMAQNNAIFNGGTGDGWSSNNFVQTSTGIFKGGSGDGWDSKNYIQANTSIFKGGFGDGWDAKNFVQASKSIFSGGIGDGWASTYKPQGPLPVSFLYFTADKLNETAAIVKWKTAQETNSNYFEIEVSTDALTFIGLGKVNAAGNSSVPVEYSFTDYKPASGVNYYRLNQVDKDGKFIYTPTKLVNFDISNAGEVKYYPNPTNGLVNIKITESMNAEAKVINISNSSGAMVNQVKINANSNTQITIDLSKFAKGIYFIQVKTTSINSTQRIVLQ